MKPKASTKFPNTNSRLSLPSSIRHDGSSVSLCAIVAACSSNLQSAKPSRRKATAAVMPPLPLATMMSRMALLQCFLWLRHEIPVQRPLEAVDSIGQDREEAVRDVVPFFGIQWLRE